MSVGGILTDLAIREAVDKGEIEIDPFDAKQLNPASYDLRLGGEVAVYDHWVYTGGEVARPMNGYRLSAYGRDGEPLPILDPRKAPQITKFAVDAERGFTLKPGIGYLFATAETVYSKKYIGVVDGKSSLGRLFVQVHCTAGYVDCGFRGNVTLEVTVTHPIVVFAGMRIAQIRFHTMHGEVGKLYSGNYTGETSKGAVASRAYKQFEIEVDNKK